MANKEYIETSYFVEIDDYTVNISIEEPSVGDLSIPDDSLVNEVSLTDDLFEIDILEVGAPGANGTDGTSAYEAAVTGGYTGTENDFNSGLADINEYLTETELDAAYAALAHTHTATDVTDFDTEVSNNTDVSANTSARHDAVTIGTANGLSLSTQELSLALSSTSTTGALSDTDWDTFNNKQDTLVSATNIKTVNSTTLLGAGDLTTEYRPTTTTVTLTVAGWSGGTSQVATVTGATATNRLKFNLPSSDAEIMEIVNQQVRPTPSTQTTDALTFVCTTTPTVEISMVCEIYPAL